MFEALIKLDERTKKIILVVCALFIILLLIFGAIYYFISKYMQKESRKVDQYMYDLCMAKIVKNPRQFKRAVYYYEKINLFNKAKWPIRLAILFTGAIFVISILFYDSNFKELFTKFTTLFPILDYQTVGEVNDSLATIDGSMSIPGPRWMPISLLPTVISKNPDFSDTKLYISTVYALIMLFCIIGIFKAVIAYIARINRGNKMAGEVFQKKLENLNIADELAKQYNSSQVNVVSETEEIN